MLLRVGSVDKLVRTLIEINSLYLLSELKIKNVRVTKFIVIYYSWYNIIRFV